MGTMAQYFEEQGRQEGEKQASTIVLRLLSNRATLLNIKIEQQKR